MLVYVRLLDQQTGQYAKMQIFTENDQVAVAALPGLELDFVQLFKDIENED